MRAFITIGVLLGVVASFAVISGTAVADAGEVGIDTDTAGNEAGSLGPIDNCIEVASGDTFDIDVYVKDIEDLIAFRIWLQYDAAVLEVADRDVELFLGTAQDTGVLDGSDATPDSDGQYEMQAVNASDTSAGASGSGVLARVTLTAVGTGISDIDLRSEDIDNNGSVDRGVYLTDIDNNPISTNDGDIYYDGTLRNGAVAVDTSCDDADPQVTGGGDDGSTVLWIVIGIAAAAIVIAAVGGVTVMRRSGGSSGSK
jgi:hypothetical protein